MTLVLVLVLVLVVYAPTSSHLDFQIAMWIVKFIAIPLESAFILQFAELTVIPLLERKLKTQSFYFG